MAETETYEFIKEIHATSEYPLYDNHQNPVEYYFSYTEAPIWKLVPGEDEKGVTPIAIAPTTQLRVELVGGAVERLKKECVKPVQLVGKYNGMVVFQCNDVTADDKLVTFTTPKMTNGKPKPLPLALTHMITWEVTGKEGKTPRFQQKTDAAIYIFPNNLPSYYNNVGISLPLLSNKSFLPRWMDLTELEATDLTWPVFVADTMFNYCRFEYETYSGSSKYVSSAGGFGDLFKAGKGVMFWIDLFTADSVVFADKHQLNCYDIAAVCQAFIALGVDQSVAKLKMVYLEPYGFINKTRLIGRTEAEQAKLAKNPKSECNNPFYMSPGYDPDMLCKNDSTKRSKFGNHMFLSMEKGGVTYIVDACAGPHLGTETLDQYIANAIDATPALYSKLTTKAAKPTDAQAGVGISRLITSRAFEKTASDDTGSKSLLDNIKQNVDELGEWTQPFLSFPFLQTRATATWTFKRQDPIKKDMYWINVFKYGDLDSLKYAYQQRIQHTPGFTARPTKTNEGYSDAFNGSVIIWCDETRRYLATIQSASGKALTAGPGPRNSPALSIFKDKFHTALDARLGVPKPVGSIIEKWEATDKDKGLDAVVTRQGREINVDIYSNSMEKDYWRGFMVATGKGNMLFLGAKPHAKTTVMRFKFLARRQGDDTATIFLFGSHLDSENQTIKFTINP